MSMMPALETHSLDLADADTLDEFYRAQTATLSEFIQMASGQALLTARSIDFGDMRLVQVFGHGHHLWIDSIVGDVWRFAILTSGSGGPKLGGHEITTHTAHLLRPGESADFLARGEYQTLEVSFDAQLAESMGWICAPGQVRSLRKAEVDTFVSCATAAGRSAAQADARAGARFARTAWRDIILDQLDMVLTPWRTRDPYSQRSASGLAHMDVIHRVRPLLKDRDLAQRLTVDQLAKASGVAKRSLFNAFRAEYGIGPGKFSEILRLNALRATLFRSAPENTSVTQAAGDYGFAELGRMAGSYRGLFGELPSETLKRVHRRHV